MASITRATLKFMKSIILADFSLHLDGNMAQQSCQECNYFQGKIEVLDELIKDTYKRKKK